MARSYVRQNVLNRFELQPRSGERSYVLVATENILRTCGSYACQSVDAADLQGFHSLATVATTARRILPAIVFKF